MENSSQFSKTKSYGKRYRFIFNSTGFEP